MLIGLKKKRSLFWILQTSGWILYLAVCLLSYWVRGGLTAPTVVRYTTAALAGYVVTALLRAFYRRLKIQGRSLLSLSLLTIMFSLLGANILIWVSNVLRYFFVGIKALTADLQPLLYVGRVFWWFTPLIGWSGLYLGLKFWQEWAVHKEQTEKAKALAQAAQLQMLRYRMNPHFLFNALNSIRALISEDKTSAKSMVTELSEYLRYSLVSRKYENVPLKDEMESIGHYFTIQKMRYESKLEVFLEIDPAAEEFPVASFLLHPLAENAVKYGLRTSPLPLKIRVKAKMHQQGLQVEISNSGSWVEPSAQNEDQAIGKGLDNVRQRLADAYPGRHFFEIAEKNGTVRARLAIGRDSWG
jgi:two-component system LytT family sensor kinase